MSLLLGIDCRFLYMYGTLVEVLWSGEFAACEGHVHLQRIFLAHFMLSVHLVFSILFS